MLPPAPWDDRTKFIAETVRTIVLGILGALAVLIAVKPWEANLAYNAEVEKARLTLSAKVVDDFLAAAYLYTSVAYDACSGNADAQRRYQGELFDRFRAAQNRLSIYFASEPTVQVRGNNLQDKTQVLFEACKSGASKDTWEAARLELKAASNSLAQEALNALGF